MSYQQGLFPVLSKGNLAKNIFDAVIYCPAIAQEARPGQFVHIRIPSHILRRPISIAGIDAAAGTIRIIYEIRGEGTKILADIKAGDMMDVLGPLGHGYTMQEPEKKCVVVGGGIGVPPLLPVARHYGHHTTAVLGFRSAQPRFSRMILKKQERPWFYVRMTAPWGGKVLLLRLWRSFCNRTPPILSVRAVPRLC